MPSPERVVPQTEVTAAIRRGILSGAAAPGQRLIEAELSELLGASRGAVRTALMDLAHEGLVERIANRGARVRVISVEEAVHITEVRMAVEGLCAAKAAERVTDADAGRLRALGERMREAVESGDVPGYSQLNQQLDERVVALAAQPVAAEILARLHARNVRHQFRLAHRPGRPRVSLREHLAIIDAICDRDPAAAERAVRDHLAGVLAALRETPEPARWA